MLWDRVCIILVGIVGLLAGYIAGCDLTIKKVKAIVAEIVEKQAQAQEEQRAKGIEALSHLMSKKE